jgi:hypothetical protein
MHVCAEDGYPMIPVRDKGPAGFAWGCSNPWHPAVPGPCPACGHTGRPHSSLLSGVMRVASCVACRHEWDPAAAG